MRKGMGIGQAIPVSTTVLTLIPVPWPLSSKLLNPISYAISPLKCLICTSRVVQFSHSVVSDSLWPHELQHTRPPCPSPTPGVHPNPCPSSRWYHPAISSSVVPFSSCPQSFPASGSFPVSQLFASGGQNIGVSASTSVLPVNPQDWSPFGWTCWISLQSKGLSRVTRPKKITWFASHHLALPQSSPSQ